MLSTIKTTIRFECTVNSIKTSNKTDKLCNPI